jgi:hypothetical protein
MMTFATSGFVEWNNVAALTCPMRGGLIGDIELNVLDDLDSVVVDAVDGSGGGASSTAAESSGHTCGVCHLPLCIDFEGSFVWFTFPSPPLHNNFDG